MFERVPSTSEALDAFLSDLELEGRSPATRQTYRSLLDPLRGSELTPETCRAYVTAKVRSGKLSSAGTAHAALSSWCKWMVMRGYLVTSPMATVPRPRKPRPVHRYLSPEEIQKLWGAANPPLQLAILVLLEGLRASEACGLRWRDVELERGVATVSGKGGKVRRVPLGAELRRRLKEREEQRFSGASMLQPQDSGARSSRDAEFSLSHTGHPRARTAYTDPILGLTPNALRLRLKRLGQLVGVPGVHPHLWRHSFASLSLKAGMSPTHLKTLGGWSKDDTMQIYVQSVMEEAALEAGRQLGLTDRLLGEHDGV
jgi:integrase